MVDWDDNTSRANLAAVGIGEMGNLAAYAFAPAILVTPLGAFSVLTGALASSYFLQERLGALDRLAIAICLMGTLIVVLHAPADAEIETAATIFHYAVQPTFLSYVAAVIAFSLLMVFKIAPVYGRNSPLVYLSVCSVVGSISVMSTKAFGIALKLTFSGENQFTNLSTYAFPLIMAGCIVIQMHYFNMALSLFPSSVVNPLYYGLFTAATLCASVALFNGLNASGVVTILSLMCGLLLIFAGVYLLSYSRSGDHRFQSLSDGDESETMSLA
ncbi:DUF803 domain membrane protein [Colletotrichum tofieldiae]|nr:DUF803 domain membrane protein [Colletotrichum tofieldiae]